MKNVKIRNVDLQLTEIKCIIVILKLLKPKKSYIKAHNKMTETWTKINMNIKKNKTFVMRSKNIQYTF